MKSPDSRASIIVISITIIIITSIHITIIIMPGTTGHNGGHNEVTILSGHRFDIIISSIIAINIAITTVIIIIIIIVIITLISSWAQRGTTTVHDEVTRFGRNQVTISGLQRGTTTGHNGVAELGSGGPLTRRGTIESPTSRATNVGSGGPLA